MKLRNIIEAFEKDRPTLSTDEKKEILQMISEYNGLGKSLQRQGSLPDVAKKLAKISEAARKLTMAEQGDWFDSQTIKKNMIALQKASEEFIRSAQEAHIHEQRMVALYEDVGHVLGRYFNIKDPIEDIKNIGDIS